MSSEQPLTISFRGLMVFHFGSDGGAQYLDVGVLPAPGHVFRVTTFRKGSGGVGTPTLLPSPRNRHWRLDAPGAQPLTKREQGQFERKSHGFDEDFRWVMDIEGPEFYGADLTDKLYTSGLKPVIRVQGGELYTKLLSPELQRMKGDGGFEDFGRIAAVTACEMTFPGGEVKLLDGDDPVLTFRKDPNIEYYEIRNTPPSDTDENPLIEVPPAGHSHDGHGGDEEDHFQFYYLMFRDAGRIEKFRFKPKGGPAGGPAPAPDPQLCGKTLLGTRTTAL